MQEFLIILIVSFIFFGIIRRFIFFNTYNAFTKAAEDFYKRQEEYEMKRRKQEGRITVTNFSPEQKGEYTDFEEVK